MFEGFAITLLQHCSNTQAAAKMLRLGWHATSDIMNRAVQRGLSRRAPEELSNIGIDEKSFKSGHHYITILNDIYLAAESLMLLRIVLQRQQKCFYKPLRSHNGTESHRGLGRHVETVCISSQKAASTRRHRS
jgi:hypothetical protein